MSGAFALAGWHFSSNPTSSSSENPVAKAKDSEPWKTGSDARYQYHPGGDPSRGRKDAPSALNEVIIPNVNLPKVCERRRCMQKGMWRTDEMPGASREVQQVGQGGLLEGKEFGGKQHLRITCSGVGTCAIDEGLVRLGYKSISFVSGADLNHSTGALSNQNYACPVSVDIHEDMLISHSANIRNWCDLSKDSR